MFSGSGARECSRNARGSPSRLVRCRPGGRRPEGAVPSRPVNVCEGPIRAQKARAAQRRKGRSEDATGPTLLRLLRGPKGRRRARARRERDGAVRGGGSIPHGETLPEEQVEWRSGRGLAHGGPMAGPHPTGVPRPPPRPPRPPFSGVTISAPLTHPSPPRPLHS